MNRKTFFSTLFLMSGVLYGGTSDAILKYSPLAANLFGFRISVAYEPYSFSREQKDTLISPFSPNGYVDSPTTSKPTFKEPWSVSGELNYAFTTHLEQFVEFTYSKGSGDARDINLLPVLTHETFSDYRSFGTYMGARYYFDRWILANLMPSLFLGVKGGVLWCESRQYNVHILSPVNFNFQNLTFTPTSLTPSVGLQAGLDMPFSQSVSLNLSYSFGQIHLPEKFKFSKLSFLKRGAGNEI
ncbi:hypothetical protein Lfee_0095, partial [Legionella feeleii]